MIQRATKSVKIQRRLPNRTEVERSFILLRLRVLLAFDVFSGGGELGWFLVAVAVKGKSFGTSRETGLEAKWQCHSVFALRGTAFKDAANIDMIRGGWGVAPLRGPPYLGPPTITTEVPS